MIQSLGIVFPVLAPRSFSIHSVLPYGTAKRGRRTQPPWWWRYQPVYVAQGVTSCCARRHCQAKPEQSFCCLLLEVLVTACVRKAACRAQFRAQGDAFTPHVCAFSPHCWLLLYQSSNVQPHAVHAGLQPAKYLTTCPALSRQATTACVTISD